jgi:hypothetical protein
MTKQEYKSLDWQSKDEMFFNWVDQYLIDNDLPSFEQEGDYGHVDLVDLRKEFMSNLL